MTTSASARTASSSSALDAALKGRLQRLAEARQRTPRGLMREAIAQYVDREEKRDAFHAAGVAAWREVEASGLHVTAEEADAWLAELEAGHDVEPPAGHV